MDTFFDKLGLYDFFSLIIGGVVFLCGNYLTGITDAQFIINMYATLDALLTIGFIFLISYLLGNFFQRIADKLFLGKYYSKTKHEILSVKDSVINNPVKLEIHRKRACKILATKGILVEEENLEKAHSAFYFGYCSYYLQIKGKHEKMEKLRGMMRLYATLTVSFFSLSLVSIIYALLYSAQLTDQRLLWGVIIYLLFMLTSYGSFKASSKAWGRIVVNAFDVCYDIENESSNH